MGADRAASQHLRDSTCAIVESPESNKIEVVVLSITPPLPPEVKVDRGPVLIVHALAFVDTHEEGVAILAPLETCPVIEQALIKNIASLTSLAEERREQIRANPEGMRYAVDNAWITGSPSEVVPVLKEAFVAPPTAQTFILWFSMAPLRELPDMALSLQTEIYFAVYVIWEDPADDGCCRTWLADRMREIEAVSVGQYLGDSDFLTRMAKFVSEENFSRLEQARKRYDADGLFHAYLSDSEATLNQNR